MLNPERALNLAARLTTVKDFPRNTDAVEAVAEDLVDLLVTVPDQEAEDRAVWLVTEIRRNWTAWGGTADMLALYDQRYPKPKVRTTTDGEFKEHVPVSVVCQVCHDTGTFRPGGRGSADPSRWCECEAGIQLHFNDPGWLDLINRLQPIPSPPPIDQNPIHPATEKELTPIPECPACQANNRHTHTLWTQYHQEQPA